MQAWLKRLPLILGGVLLVLLVAAAAVPFLIPAAQYKAQIERSAGEATGRAFKIAGPIRFTLWPNLGVKAEQVTIANAPGGAAPLFASIDAMEIGVAFQPLLKGDVQVKTLKLKKLGVWLEEDAGGKPNWVFEPKQKAKAQPGGAPELKELGLGDVRIEDGGVSYRDKAGKLTAISALNASVSLPGLDGPFRVAGDFVFNGDKADIKIELAEPRAFLRKAQTPLQFALQAPKLDVTFNGALNAADMSLAGKVEAKGASLRQLAAWSGNPIGPGGGMGAFSAAGECTFAGAELGLKNAAFALDAAKGRGDLKIRTDPQKPPYVSGALALDALDVNPYLAPTAAGGAQAASGVNVNAPWGNAPIDLSGLKAIDADLKLTTGPLLFQKIKIDRTAMDLKLRGGVLNATLNSLALYGGTGAGALTLDGANPAAKFANRLVVKGLAAEPFLTDAIGLNKISGRVTLDLSIAGTGRTQQQIMDTLSGKAAFSFADGAMKGVNLAALARQAQTLLSGQAAAAAAAPQTDFSELKASFAIAKGVAHTNNGAVASPYIRINGANGDLDLARQTLLIKARAKLVKTAEGQGGALGSTLIEAPLIAQGPWAALKFGIDQEQLKQEAVGALKQKATQELTKKFGGSDLSSVLGGKKNADGSSQGGLLDQLLKKK